LVADGSTGAGAGIGSTHGSVLPFGSITINGGTITAAGGTHSAGIGGAGGFGGGSVTINGGNITATGGRSAGRSGGGPGIGSGTYVTPDPTVITITGGTITAKGTAGVGGAGIGGGSGSSGGTINIAVTGVNADVNINAVGGGVWTGNGHTDAAASIGNGSGGILNGPKYYGISLDPATDKDFGSVAERYAAQTPHSVTVNNMGDQTAEVTIALSGANGSSFSLSTASIPSIAAGGSGNFTVAPKTGLAAGTYKATVTSTVTVADGVIIASQSFDVNFTVTSNSGGGGGSGGGCSAGFGALAIAALTGLLALRKR